MLSLSLSLAVVVIPETLNDKQNNNNVMGNLLKNDFNCQQQGIVPGGGGGYSEFFLVHRFVPSIYSLACPAPPPPPKKISGLTGYPKISGFSIYTQNT